MRKLIIATLLAVSVAGCVEPDEFGNTHDPNAIGDFTYNDVVEYKVATVDEVKTWCAANNGALSGDAHGCVEVFDTVIPIDRPCTYVTLAGDGEKQAQSVHRYLRDVCNGWAPHEEFFVGKAL